MAKTTRLVFTFYRSFLPASVAVTLVCILILLQFGADAVSLLFWLKVITSGIIFYYINTCKSNQFFYFRNLGISKTRLWTASLLLDFGFFLLPAWLMFTLL